MSYSNKQRDKVADYIKRNIADERYRPGDKLPTEMKLSQTLNVSRVTVRRALDMLESDDIINRVFGKGAFVKQKAYAPVKQIVPFIVQTANNNSRFIDIYTGVQDYFSSYNIQPLLSVTGFNHIKEREAILDFFDNGYRYMLIMSAFSDKNVEFYWSMMNRGVTFAFVDKTPFDIPCDSVTSNNFEGAYNATRYLISKGHRKIALVVPQSFESASTTCDRFAGYRIAMIQDGLFSNSLIFKAQNRTAQSIIEEIFEKCPDVTALFALSDYSAIKLLKYLNEKNIKISIFGFDNLKETSSCSPALSTVEQQFYQLGFSAAKILRERMVDPQKPYVKETLSTKLILRNSVFDINTHPLLFDYS